MPATASFFPAKLKSYAAVETKEKAMALEKYFKTGGHEAVSVTFSPSDTCVLRELQNHRFYPKISLFVPRFSVRCERRSSGYACPEPLTLLGFCKSGLEVRC